jgi:hypothetical protein
LLQGLGRASQEPWNSHVDPAQVETALVNLAINARDAMEGVGSLKIVVVNAVVDEAFARLHEDAEPGQYVVLTVTDTGIGMSADLMARRLSRSLPRNLTGRIRSWAFNGLRLREKFRRQGVPALLVLKSLGIPSARLDQAKRH